MSFLAQSSVVNSNLQWKRRANASLGGCPTGAHTLADKTASWDILLPFTEQLVFIYVLETCTVCLEHLAG